MANADKKKIEAAAKECFVGKSMISVSLFTQALKKRNVVTRKKLSRIVGSTDYLQLTNNNQVVKLLRDIFTEMPMSPSTPLPCNMVADHLEVTPVPSTASTFASPLPCDMAVHHSQDTPESSITSTAAARHDEVTIKTIPPVAVTCDTDAIADLLGDVTIEDLDLDDNGLTDIFIDVGSYASAKINGECVLFNRAVGQLDISMILECLPGGGPTTTRSNRVIFGQTLHRLAAVTYDGVVTGVTIRVGRSVSGLVPVFEGLVENKNVLLCGAPNVGKTTTLREICKYLSRGKCLCLIDTSGEVCGDTGNKDHIVGTSRVFRPVDPDKQYATLLDCVRNHSPDVIAIDELNTREEVGVCQTIALRSIQMVASVHGNIQDLVFNPMLNKALGGSTQAIVSDRIAVDGKKIVTQRTTRPIFDVVINIKRSSLGLEYAFIEDVAGNVSRIMEGKPIQTRTRRIVGDELLETIEEVVFPFE